MSKDTDDCELMNELFDSGEEPRKLIHWRPVAIYHEDGEKIRDLTKKEQLDWIKEQRGKDR